MRRQNVQLVALARQGDPLARCEVGRRYLLGVDGFPRHLQTGVDYLTHESLRQHAQAARVLAENLPLEELARLGLGDWLARAALSDSAACKVKHAVWTLVHDDDVPTALRDLRAAAALGHVGAARALASLPAPSLRTPLLAAVLRALAPGSEMNAAEVAILAARRAAEADDLDRLLGALDAAIGLSEAVTPEIDELVVQAARLAESLGRQVTPLTPAQLEQSLDRRAHQGDSWAAFAFGRALCGIACGAMAPSDLSVSLNVRRGTALLFRAADAGWAEAWLHLYKLHADHRLSVANSQMARFCLEKAALLGQRQAQCKLGALMLRSAASLADSEQAIGWLHQAASQGDALALDLLRSLHLPLEGSERDARAAIALVRRDDPWLAMRMQLSRDFGLTKLEALCVDPVAGMRPWGLVVGRNPFVVQSRLSAPRAVPALTPAALDNLRRMVMMFSESGRDGYALEGDARRRSLVQRRAFDKHGIDEAMFFAKASANILDTLRQGTRWAFRAKAQLQLALAA